MRVDATTELGVLEQCVRGLQSLAGDPAAQQRVLRYLVDRFNLRRDLPVTDKVFGPTDPAAQRAVAREAFAAGQVCKCGRVTLSVGPDVIIGDGSQHSLTGCHPPSIPRDASTEGYEEDQSR